MPRSDQVELVKALESLYGSPEDMDSWLGGILEKPDTGVVGSLFSKNIEQQFLRLRDGDRYWYEYIYSGQNLKDIQAVFIADIVKRNYQGFDSLTDAFDPLT